jgi:hypothetical protein
MAKIWTVTIREVGTRALEYTTRVRTETREEALERALHKLWGTGTIWEPDSGVPGYGQVFKSVAVLGLPGSGYTSRTHRAALTIT